MLLELFTIAPVTPSGVEESKPAEPEVAFSVNAPAPDENVIPKTLERLPFAMLFVATPELAPENSKGDPVEGVVPNPVDQSPEPPVQFGAAAPAPYDNLR